MWGDSIESPRKADFSGIVGILKDFESVFLISCPDQRLGLTAVFISQLKTYSPPTSA